MRACGRGVACMVSAEKVCGHGFGTENGIRAGAAVAPCGLTAIIEHRAAANLVSHPCGAGGVEVFCGDRIRHENCSHGAGCDWHRRWLLSVGVRRHILQLLRPLEQL